VALAQQLSERPGAFRAEQLAQRVIDFLLAGDGVLGRQDASV
jgi:hypothetical protein